jgi:hypothetical protein
MADATQLPILVDGDTGDGNFSTVRWSRAQAVRASRAGNSLPPMKGLVLEKSLSSMQTPAT